MVKIAVLVSGGGTNLQALIDRQQAGELGCGQIKPGHQFPGRRLCPGTGRKSRYRVDGDQPKRVRQCRKL